MNRAFYIKRNGLFVPDRCRVNPAFLGSWKKPVSGGGGGGGGGGTYSLVDHAIGNDVSSAVATMGNSTGAKLIIGAMSYFSGTAVVSDNKGNTYTGLTAHHNVDSTYFTKLFYCISPSVGASHALTGTASGGGFIVLNAYAFAISSGTPVFDSENGTNHDGSNVTTLAVGSLTPSGSSNLFVAVATWSSPGSTPVVSIDSSFNTPTQSQQGTNNLFGGFSYLIATGSGAVNATWTFNNTINVSSSADGTFK